MTIATQGLFAKFADGSILRVIGYENGTIAGLWTMVVLLPDGFGMSVRSPVFLNHFGAFLEFVESA